MEIVSIGQADCCTPSYEQHIFENFVHVDHAVSTCVGQWLLHE